MGTFLKLAELLAIAIWLGATIFAWIITTAVASTDAAPVLRVLLPRYYLTGILCGFVLVAVSSARGVLWGWTGMQPVSAALFAVAAALMLIARFALPPTLSTVAIVVNAVVLLLLLAYVYWMSVRGY